jgi:hypothetical protein
MLAALAKMETWAGGSLSRLFPGRAIVRQYSAPRSFFLSAFGTRSRVDLCEERSNLFDELCCPVDRRARPIERHARAWPQLVISNRFQVVGLRQKQGEVGKLRLLPCQLRQQTLHAPVRLGGSPGARADDGLRLVKAGQVGITAGVFPDATARMMRARARQSRALSRRSPISGVTDRRPRVEFRPSARSGSGTRPRDTAWRR